MDLIVKGNGKLSEFTINGSGKVLEFVFKGSGKLSECVIKVDRGPVGIVLNLEAGVNWVKI